MAVRPASAFEFDGQAGGAGPPMSLPNMGAGVVVSLVSPLGCVGWMVAGLAGVWGATKATARPTPPGPPFAGSCWRARQAGQGRQRYTPRASAVPPPDEHAGLLLLPRLSGCRPSGRRAATAQTVCLLRAAQHSAWPAGRPGSAGRRDVSGRPRYPFAHRAGRRSLLLCYRRVGERPFPRHISLGACKPASSHALLAARSPRCCRPPRRPRAIRPPPPRSALRR